MEIEIHKNQKSVSASFAGADKLEKIRGKLKDIIKNDISQTRSEPIKLAIQLYADTVEDAVGIALEMQFLMSLKQETDELEKILSEIPSAKDIDDPFDTAFDIFKKMNKKSPDEPDSEIGMLDTMGRMDCETCDKNGDCPTQKLADVIVPEWREGREL